MTIKILAIVALVTVAQLIPSCDQGSVREVIGYVDEKRQRNDETLPHLIVINHIEYGVPHEFWLSVGIGDLVKYDGWKWTLLRKARP